MKMSFEKTPGEVARDLHELLNSYLVKNKVRASWVESWLCITLLGTMEMQGHSRERFQRTLDRMMSEFDKKRRNKPERLS